MDNRKPERVAIQNAEEKDMKNEISPICVANSFLGTVDDSSGPVVEVPMISSDTRKIVRTANLEQSDLNMAKPPFDDSVPASLQSELQKPAESNPIKSGLANVPENILNLQEENYELKLEANAANRNAEAPTTQMYIECQEMLQMFGIPYIIAPMEVSLDS